MLRGLRTTSDMESEFSMSLMNLNLDPEIETVFLMAKEPHSHLSSTLLRQIATFGGKLEGFLPPSSPRASRPASANARRTRRTKRGEKHPCCASRGGFAHARK